MDFYWTTLDYGARFTVDTNSSSTVTGMIARVDSGRAETALHERTLEQQYLLSVDKTIDEDVARAISTEFAYNYGANTYDGARLTRTNVESIQDTNNKYWRIDYTWSWTRSSGGGGEIVPIKNYSGIHYIPEQFSTSGGTAHVTQAINETRYPLTEEPIPNMYGAVGWNGEEFEGVDIVVPTMSFSLSNSYTWEEVNRNTYTTDGYVNHGLRELWQRYTGRVNRGQYYGCADGTLLFMGASGGSREVLSDVYVINGVAYQDVLIIYDMTFQFNFSPNNGNFPVGDSGVIIPKPGWDHVWTLTERYDDDESGRMFKRATGAYVDQMYYYENFGNLNVFNEWTNGQYSVVPRIEG